MFFALGFVDVLDGEDAASYFAVLVADGGGGGTEPGAGTVVGLVEELFGDRGFALQDGAGEGVLAGIELVAVGVEGS